MKNGGGIARLGGNKGEVKKEGGSRKMREAGGGGRRRWKKSISGGREGTAG